MSQMLMQNQNLRPPISLNQPLIHHIQGCKILPLNQVLIQMNPRAQVFPYKKEELHQHLMQIKSETASFPPPQQGTLFLI